MNAPTVEGPARLYFLPFPGLWQVVCDECGSTDGFTFQQDAHRVKREHNVNVHGATK